MPCGRILWWGCSPGTRRQQARSETPHLVDHGQKPPAMPGQLVPERSRAVVDSDAIDEIDLLEASRSRDVSVRALIVRSSSCSAENRCGPSASEATISTVHRRQRTSSA